MASLLAFTALATLLLVLGGGVQGEKKLSHPSLTGVPTLTLKVLYW